jgi:hypothetical protein
MMAPFQDCLGCHGRGEGKAWTVAGTWAKGAHVSVTDANGKTVPMRGNDAGNFYTAEPLAFPLTVSVNGKVMPDPAILTEPRPPAKLTYGGCNLCHRAEQVTMTFGPEMLPGSDCLTCHRPGGMSSTTFYAAGTFPPPQWPAGTTVRVGGQTTNTNAVGNFYITTPLTFPTAASVAGASMEGGAPYGGCNACHVNGNAPGD